MRLNFPAFGNRATLRAMLSVRDRSWLPAKLLLLVLLGGAQSGALAHAFEHDAATPQQQACVICVTLGQLDTSCVATPTAIVVTDFRSCRPIARVVMLQTLRAPVARQRGPPITL